MMASLKQRPAKGSHSRGSPSPELNDENATQQPPPDENSRFIVAVRVRPLSEKERAKGSPSVVTTHDAHGVITVHDPGHFADNELRQRRIRERRYAFDSVFGAGVSTLHVYEGTAKRLVPAVLQGLNATVFAYGPTGSGKTYTMLGTPSQPGIMVLTLRDLYAAINSANATASVLRSPLKAQQQGKGASAALGSAATSSLASSTSSSNIKVTVSFIEIYCETIRDLLAGPSVADAAGGSNSSSSRAPMPVNGASAAPAGVGGISSSSVSSSSGASAALELREDPIKGPCVAGVTEHEVSNVDHILALIAEGNRRRTQEATAANATSSRSHAILQVCVEQRPPRGRSGITRVSKLSLVDLAGSERASQTLNRGIRLQEGANINRSLLSLGNCINALVSGKGKCYVPYRDSKLTRLLKDSLGGCSTRSVMLGCISPSEAAFEETVNSLKWCDRAKQLRVVMPPPVLAAGADVSGGSGVGGGVSAAAVAEYEALIAQLRAEVASLKQQLAAPPQQDPVAAPVFLSPSGLIHHRSVPDIAHHPSSATSGGDGVSVMGTRHPAPSGAVQRASLLAKLPPSPVRLRPSAAVAADSSSESAAQPSSSSASGSATLTAGSFSPHGAFAVYPPPPSGLLPPSTAVQAANGASSTPVSSAVAADFTAGSMGISSGSGGSGSVLPGGRRSLSLPPRPYSAGDALAAAAQQRQEGSAGGTGNSGDSSQPLSDAERQQLAGQYEANVAERTQLQMALAELRAQDAHTSTALTKRRAAVKSLEASASASSSKDKAELLPAACKEVQDLEAASAANSRTAAELRRRLEGNETDCAALRLRLGGGGSGEHEETGSVSDGSAAGAGGISSFRGGSAKFGAVISNSSRGAMARRGRQGSTASTEMLLQLDLRTRSSELAAVEAERDAALHSQALADRDRRIARLEAQVAARDSAMQKLLAAVSSQLETSASGIGNASISPKVGIDAALIAALFRDALSSSSSAADESAATSPMSQADHESEAASGDGDITLSNAPASAASAFCAPAAAAASPSTSSSANDSEADSSAEDDRDHDDVGGPASSLADASAVNTTSLLIPSLQEMMDVLSHEEDSSDLPHSEAGDAATGSSNDVSGNRLSVLEKEEVEGGDSGRYYANDDDDIMLGESVGLIYAQTLPQGHDDSSFSGGAVAAAAIGSGDGPTGDSKRHRRHGRKGSTGKAAVPTKTPLPLLSAFSSSSSVVLKSAAGNGKALSPHLVKYPNTASAKPALGGNDVGTSADSRSPSSGSVASSVLSASIPQFRPLFQMAQSPQRPPAKRPGGEIAASAPAPSIPAGALAGGGARSFFVSPASAGPQTSASAALAKQPSFSVVSLRAPSPINAEASSASKVANKPPVPQQQRSVKATGAGASGSGDSKPGGASSKHQPTGPQRRQVASPTKTPANAQSQKQQRGRGSGASNGSSVPHASRHSHSHDEGPTQLPSHGSFNFAALQPVPRPKGGPKR